MGHSDHYKEGQRYKTLYDLLFGNNLFITAKDILNTFDNLKEKENLTLVDIGGGNGLVISYLKGSYENNHKFILVEPSQEMLNESEFNENRPDVLILNDAENFAINNTENFDAVLLKECIHHVQNLEFLLTEIYKKLNSGGKILIITRPLEVNFQFGDNAKMSWKNSYKFDPMDIVDMMKRVGFKSKCEIKGYEINVEKTNWIDMNTISPIFSNISSLSPEQREQDKKQILKVNEEKEILNFLDNQLFIIGQKN